VRFFEGGAFSLPVFVSGFFLLDCSRCFSSRAPSPLHHHQTQTTPQQHQTGTGNEQRLTGKHETCDIDTFKFGVADRGSSIRIPLPVQLQGYGYLEDRRPAANVDPYTVARLLIKTTIKG
jgi:hypothetical protein